MGQIVNFGVGFLTAIVGSQPIPIGVLTDVNIDISYTLKELIGQSQFALDIAKAEGKITGKATFKTVNSLLLQQILSGATVAAGNVQGIYLEGPATPTANSITAVHGATFKQDLGVWDTTSQKWLTWVAAGPTTGQYSVVPATGVYTFAAADSTHLMALCYSWTVAATGQTVSLTNQLMGTQTYFQLALYENYSSSPIGGQAGIMLPNVAISKMALSFKNNDYTGDEIDFQACQNLAGQVAYAYTSV
jgi:hypothetical protein